MIFLASFFGRLKIIFTTSRDKINKVESNTEKIIITETGILTKEESLRSLPDNDIRVSIIPALIVARRMRKIS
jgi:hypothetical protein